MKLHDDIELVTLENLIQRFEEKLCKNLTESDWQKLFNGCKTAWKNVQGIGENSVENCPP